MELKNILVRLLSVRHSSETEPWGFEARNEFLNMVVKVETELDHEGLLRMIVRIETMLGRVRNEKRYTSRLIDIDVLLYGDHIIKSKDLKIPHPLMHKRKFVLVPLCEIAPEKVHPVLKMSISAMLKSCEDKSKVQKYR